MNGTLAAVSNSAMMPNMAEMLAFGEVAEWFKAAVLKTAPENIGISRFSARLTHFSRRNSRVRASFAKNTQAQESAHGLSL